MPQPGEKQSPIKAEYLHGLRALVVEDDHLIQTIISSNLHSIGIDAKVVDNGVQAIETLKNYSFDFILMDINMPEQDGLDATRWIRDIQRDPVKDLPIFALTSYSSSEHTREILAAGMNEHLVKPFHLQKLLPVLEKYFWNR
jgi:CheY-like chemotaxis protein